MYIVEGDTFFKDLFRYSLAREGVCAPSGPVCLAHAMQKSKLYCEPDGLRLAFFVICG